MENSKIVILVDYQYRVEPLINDPLKYYVANFSTKNS